MKNHFDNFVVYFEFLNYLLVLFQREQNSERAFHISQVFTKKKIYLAIRMEIHVPEMRKNIMDFVNNKRERRRNMIFQIYYPQYPEKRKIESLQTNDRRREFCQWPLEKKRRMFISTSSLLL